MMALRMVDDDADMRVVVEDIAPKRSRNYDIEGLLPNPGPPEARDAVYPPSRQQRRWLERQSKKHR